MRKLKRSIAAAMMMTLSLSMLPAQIQPTEVSAAQVKKVSVKKTEITVSSNKAIKSALKKKGIKRIVLNAVSAKKVKVPKGNYKTKTLVINLSEKSKIHIEKGAKFKKIILIGTVKNASLQLDETGNKIEIASKTNLNINGKASYAELTYKAGSESAKVISKIELVVNNKTAKTIKLDIAGSSVRVKSGETYAKSDLNIEDDETAQGEAVINNKEDSRKTEDNSENNKTNSEGDNKQSINGNILGIGGGSTAVGNTGNSGNGAAIPLKPEKPDSKTNNVEKPDSKIINVEKTKVMNATNFLRYVIVNFVNGYTKDNTTVYVDGVDITSELTKVDTEGTIYKWEVYGKYPAEVKVVSKKNDGINQIVKLDRPSKVKVVTPVVTNMRRTPEFVIGSSRISRFDYYLDNFDDEGNRRMLPAVTTFNSDFKNAQKISEKPYYAPDVEVGKDLTVMFNYSSDEDKKWFDNIPDKGALQLVEDDESQNTIKRDVQYEKKFVQHGGQKAALVLKTGGTNFRSAGYFRLRVKSEGSKSYMLRIRLENPGQPKLYLSEPSVESGKNLHFKVEGVTQGVRNAVEKVELTLPNKEVKTLRHNVDYNFFGGSFVLYNDVKAGKEEDGTKGENNTLYKGSYTIKVYFNEYKPATFDFDIENGQEIESNKVSAMGSRTSLMSIDGMKIDAIAGATSKVKPSRGGSGSSESYIGSLAIVRDLIFDTDMLANAEIITKLGIKNDYASAIVDRFEKQVTVKAVYNKNSEFYDFAKYNSVMVADREDGRFLTFAEYMKLPETKSSIVRKIKNANAVLEDNMIGGVLDGNHLGESAPEFSFPNGKNVPINGEISIEANAEYLKKIRALHPEKDAGLHFVYTMGKGDYKIEDNRLTIKGLGLINRYAASSEKLPKKVKVVVVADEYQAQTIELTVVKDEEKKEDGLRSLIMPESKKFNANIWRGTMTIGPNFGVKTANNDYSVKNWIASISSITIDGKPYKRNLKPAIRPKEEEFQISSVLEIAVPKSKSQNISMVIEADGYKSYTFTIDNKGERPEIVDGKETVGETAKPNDTVVNPGNNVDTSTPGKTEKEEKKSLNVKDYKDNFYFWSSTSSFKIRNIFGSYENEKVKEWLKNVKSVKVGGIDYRMATSSSPVKNEFRFVSITRELEIRRPEGNNGKQIPVIIEADGYKSYTFTIDNSGEKAVLVNVEETNKDVSTDTDEKAEKAKDSEKNEESKKETEIDDNLIKLEMPAKFKVGVDTDDKFTIKKNFLGDKNTGITQSWLEKVTKIIVNGVQYKEVVGSMISGLKENEFAKTKGILDDTRIEVSRPLGLSAEENKKVTLEIQAEGYKTYIFTFDNTHSAVEFTDGIEKK